jgi:RNA polymerase sigma-70 factor (ECF subfamily)
MEENSRSSNSDLFPETRWTLVNELRHGETLMKDAATSRLCETYWRPLYIHLRSKGRSHHDAEDLVQSFLAKVCRDGLFSKSNASRGKLRTLLLTSLQNFERDEYRKESRQRRGGDSTIISFDLDETEKQVANIRSMEGEHASTFDYAWALTIMSSAKDQLIAEYTERDASEICEGLTPLLTKKGTKRQYEDLGKIFNKSGNAIKMELSRMRKRYGTLLHETVAETVTHPDDIHNEVAYLLELMNRIA